MENNFKLGDFVYFLTGMGIRRGYIVNMRYDSYEIEDNIFTKSNLIYFEILQKDGYVYSADTNSEIIRYSKKEIIKTLENQKNIKEN